MITSLDFHRLKYNNPEKAITNTGTLIDRIIGLDSEAYTDGVPFMLAASTGDIIDPFNLPEPFFINKFINCNFMLYNMKYDSGAILYHLPEENLIELWKENKTKYRGFTYSYIPHKLLRIKKGRDKVNFWDIAQFYKSSLDNAAKEYLNDKKTAIKTKKFSRQYVQKYYNSIKKYCIQDAKLTQRLAVYFVNKLCEFGITPSGIYSSASISFKYFCDNTPIVTSYRFWKNNKRILKFACDAYEGGKFEVTQRGAFHGYEYDITSAYPYEIANLIDISSAEYVYSAHYQRDSIYALIRVEIDNTKNPRHIPCGIMVKNVRVYPAGRFFRTITKEEYDYLVSINVPVKIHEGYWFYTAKKSYPYREAIAELFKIKARYKNRDKMLTSTAKIAMNGFYGKLVQVIEQPDKTFQAGPGWNPIYGSIITANTRIKVTRFQNLLAGDCLAVHTDSVITKKPLPPALAPGGIGNFEYVDEGPGVLIACGMYQLNDAAAFKGFKPQKNPKTNEYDTWYDILSRNYRRKKIKYKITNKVESWIEAMAKNHGKKSINVFSDDYKIIDLNCDSKRAWPEDMTAKKLLTTLQDSTHRIMIEPRPPEYWKG